MGAVTFVAIDGGTPTVPLPGVGYIFFDGGRFTTDEERAVRALRAYNARHPGWIREIVREEGAPVLPLAFCGAPTKQGAPCRRYPIDGFTHCRHHADTEGRGYGGVPDGDAGIGLQTAINPGDHKPTEAGAPGLTKDWAVDVASDVETALADDMDPLSRIFNEGVG